MLRHAQIVSSCRSYDLGIGLIRYICFVGVASIPLLEEVQQSTSSVATDPDADKFGV
jgi:hypothetical protein